MKYRGTFLHLSVLLTVLLVGFLVDDVNAQASSQYRLVGVASAKDFAGAVLDDGKSGQILYQKGEQLPDGSRIAKVQKDSITIKQSDGTSYDLFLLQSAPPSAQARASAGSGAGSAAPPLQQKQAAPQTNAAPPGTPSGPSIGQQGQGADTAKRRGKNSRPRHRSPRASSED